MSNVKKLADLAKTIRNVTEARRSATRALCKEFKMKKTDLVNLLLSISDKQRMRFNRKTISKIDPLLNTKTKLKEKFKDDFPLRVSTSSWAGGAYFDFKLATFNQSWSFTTSELTVYSKKEYSENGKWSGNKTVHTLWLMPSSDFETIGGLFTIFPKRLRNQPCECKWYEQGRGFEINEKRGFLIEDYHIEKTYKINTLEDAIAQFKKQQNVKKSRKKKLLTLEVVRDKYNMCEPGIRNFCKLNDIDINSSITIDDLEQIVNRNLNLNKMYKKDLAKLGIQL